VIASTIDTPTIIVDSREDYEFLGTPHLSKGQITRYKAGAFTRGAIPGARHLNWSESVDLHADHTFKSLADLNHNFRKQGIVPHKNIIVYCQSGVRSAHTTFVLKHLLGYPNVKNYDGSWIEWSYVHASGKVGTIEHHTSQEEAEIIYRKLADKLQEERIN
jgi:thiosulfate/3-mercaptopyruvate sulfurtransferase